MKLNRSVDPKPEIPLNLRIPGPWTSLADVRANLPEGWSIRKNHLAHDDLDGRAEVVMMPADRMFPRVFCQACVPPALPAERAIARAYRHNACLVATGGCPARVRTLGLLATALLDAGGGGVLVDSGCTARGASEWRSLLGEKGIEPLIMAFVALAGSGDEVRSQGMHAFGRADIIAPLRPDDPAAPELMFRMLFTSADEPPIVEEPVTATDRYGRQYELVHEPAERNWRGSIAWNPFGHVRLVPVGEDFLARRAN